MIARFGWGLLFAFLLLVAGLISLGVVFMNRSVPELEGTATVRGIQNRVEIDRDSLGIPNISAKTDEDAYFGLGYAEAQDRLFQMEMTRRIGEGRLSELVGNKGLVVDIWARTIGFSRIAHQLWLQASPETKRYLIAYVHGINAYISEHQTQPGFEFDALKIQPEYWRVEECLIIGRLMSWEMNFSYWTDATFGDIALSVDSTHLHSLFPDYPADGSSVLEGATPQTIAARWDGNLLNNIATTLPHSPKSGSPILKSDSAASRDSTLNKVSPSPPKSPNPKHNSHADDLPNQITPNQLNQVRAVFADLRIVNGEIERLLGAHVPGGGSNAIALSADRTTSGAAPMLENDTHLRLGTPARWYLAHLRSQEGLNVAGFSIPGLPVILCGRNEKLSWSITNGMADESDFFVESPDSSGAYYRTPGGMKAFVEFEDSIHIRDSIGSTSMHSIGIEIRQTIHGPIISDHPSHFTQFIYHHPRAGGVPKDTSIFYRSHPVSLAWNGEYALSDEVGACFALHKAHSIRDARSVLKAFATPVINMCFAEAPSRQMPKGEIGYQYVGRLPRRSGSEERLLLPRDGSNASDQWLGFIPLSEMPSLSNPARGYLVSANNPPTRIRPFPISNNWEPPARADRIAQLLEQGKRFDTHSLTQVVLDVTSPLDRDVILPRLLALYPDPNPLTTMPDSTWIFRLDSLRHSWKWDSLRHHTSLTDSLARRMAFDDSLQLKRSSDATLKQIASAPSSSDPIANSALEYLRNWDGNMGVTETAAAIYAVFLNTLLKNTFYDELGQQRYDEFIFVSNVPLRTLERIIDDNTNIWWDDISTPTIRETRDSIFVRSFKEALSDLERRFGMDMRLWQWGQLHQMTYHHQLEAAGPAIAKIVNIESGPAPGGLTTVSQASYDLWDPYAMWVGPSMRMIADMSTTSLLAALPTGNSETIFGPHYKDMLSMFKAGQYDALSLESSTSDLPPSWKRFELLPSE